MEILEKKEVTILFAGDSGDGIQLTGTQFSNTNALFGNDISTFPNFPAEIRAPQGTVAGVSGFQLKFGDEKIFTPGDSCDVLVVMNAAALKANLSKLKKGGHIIANIEGFDKRNLKLAGYEDLNPLESELIHGYSIIHLEVTKLTRETLTDSELSKKDKDRCKNMFVLGYLCWMYNRELNTIEDFLKSKFDSKQDILKANIDVLRSGFNFGDTNEEFTSRYNVKKATLESGSYRSITGNSATALGLISASVKSGLQLVFGSYPITPASDILHELARHKNFNVKTFQAEDEIAAVCSAIGASFGGALGVTASSGPGIALKGEAIGLQVMLELPMVIINVQRGGPSTGLPTKTEQADLLQAYYGRNGECPVPIVAASTPKDCFDAVFEAARIAVEHMTPVFFLSDGYIANGAEPWKYPSSKELEEIVVNGVQVDAENYKPYQRDEKGVRPWVVPGNKGYEHRVGGLEKEAETGNVSYDPDNHERMVLARAKKVANIANYIPKQHILSGADSGELLVVGWGSTYGAIKTAVDKCIEEGLSVSHMQIRHLNPLPGNLNDIFKEFENVLVPEINNGQLVRILNAEFDIQAKPLNKIQGLPFTSGEIYKEIKSLLG